jgi:hypothetical protein
MRSPARPGRATNSPDRGNDDRRTMGACHSCRSTPDRLRGYGPSGIGGSVVHRSGHVHGDLHYRAVRTQGTSPEPRQLRGRRKQLAPNVCVSYRRPSQPVCCGDLFLGIRRHGARSLSPVAPPQVKAPESEGHREYSCNSTPPDKGLPQCEQDRPDKERGAYPRIRNLVGHVATFRVSVLGSCGEEHGGEVSPGKPRWENAYLCRCDSASRG